MTHYKPYSIITPEYQITSGGIRVLYALHGWLLAKGQISFLNLFPKDTHDFVCVYPEISNGNLTNSDHVVRYILNTPGAMRNNGVPGPKTFPPEDKLYYFSRLYGGNDTNTMFLPVLNLHLFKVTNKGKRYKKCMFKGKGVDLHLPETEGLFEVTRPFANDQGKLAEYLNECEVMYSYDNNSAMFEIARLCGCRIVIIPSLFTKEQFSQYEPGMNGISYGLEENVPLDAYQFRHHYQDIIKTFENRLEEFIDETQNN